MSSTYFIPRYLQRETPTIFVRGVLPQNPIENGDQPFHRLPGKQTLVLEDLTTGFQASARFDGGYIANTGGYGNFALSNFFLVKGFEVECTVTRISDNVYQINTSVNDSGGRTYVITFSPLAGVPPKLRKTAGAAIVADFSITIQDVYVRSDQTYQQQ